MNTKDYTKWVEAKMVTSGQTRLVENILGLAGETGEVVEKVKKSLRDDRTLDIDAFLLELSDVLFYLTGLAEYVGSDLQEVLDINVKKLDSREKRGTLRGSGDNR